MDNKLDTDERDPAPMRDKRVEQAIQRLDARLRQVLGEGAEFCLVISHDVAGVDHVQAMTNTTAVRALVLMRACEACGFETYH